MKLKQGSQQRSFIGLLNQSVCPSHCPTPNTEPRQLAFFPGKALKGCSLKKLNQTVGESHRFSMDVTSPITKGFLILESAGLEAENLFSAHFP